MKAKRSLLPRLDLRALPGPEDVGRQELPNGIVILARENFTTPSVVLSGYVAAGAIQTNGQRAGLADLTAAAMMRGTEGRSFRDIFEAIESIGANLGLTANEHTTTFQGKALSEELPLLIDLLSDILRRPVFPTKEVSRLRAEALTDLAVRDQDTGALAEMAFDELAYPGHPYSIPVEGYRETVRELGASHLRAFHRKNFGPRGMLIAVVGAVPSQGAIDAVVSAFAEWRNPRQAVDVDLPPVSKPDGLVRRNVHLPGKSQCDVIVGVPGPSRFDPGFLAAALGNNILGRFGLMGRIGEALRSKAGLAYYAMSKLAAGPGPAPWEVSAGVDPRNVERAIDLIRKEIQRFITRRVTDEELTDNQAQFIGRLPLQLEANEGVAVSLVHAERYGLGLDYYRRFPDLIAAVTRDQVLEAAQRFLDPDRLAIAVAGTLSGKE